QLSSNPHQLVRLWHGRCYASPLRRIQCSGGVQIWRNALRRPTGADRLQGSIGMGRKIRVSSPLVMRRIEREALPAPAERTALADLYRQMLGIRRMEEAAAKAYAQGKI